MFSLKDSAFIYKRKKSLNQWFKIRIIDWGLVFLCYFSICNYKVTLFKIYGA